MRRTLKRSRIQKQPPVSKPMMKKIRQMALASWKKAGGKPEDFTPEVYADIPEDPSHGGCRSGFASQAD